MDLNVVAENSKTVLSPGDHIHLIGIGGFGISAIARVLSGQGYDVSGSDMSRNEITKTLQNEGITVYEGHRAENITSADMLVISSAIPSDNPEILAGVDRGIPIFKRSEFLGQLTGEKQTIAVAGTHGKTTTTAMLAKILLEADLDPSIILGGILPDIGGNGRAGQGRHFLIEADEYDNMFLGLRPSLSIVTNIDFDHPDMFPTKDAYRQAFARYVGRHSEGSRIIVRSDKHDSHQLVLDNVGNEVLVETFGLKNGDWLALELRPNQVGGTDFVAQENGTDLGLVRLQVPGKHNVENALAAAAAAVRLGLNFHTVIQALGKFQGVNRRFQIVGEVGSVTVVDDYAHHPKEIEVTLNAAKELFPGRAIWAIWQPHTYSRLEQFYDEFASCFQSADHVVMLDIFKSRESDIQQVNSAEIALGLRHPDVSYQKSFKTAVEYLLNNVQPGDVLISLTAGDGNEVGVDFLERLRRNSQNGSRSQQ